MIMPGRQKKPQACSRPLPEDSSMAEAGTSEEEAPEVTAPEESLLTKGDPPSRARFPSLNEGGVVLGISKRQRMTAEETVLVLPRNWLKRKKCQTRFVYSLVFTRTRTLGLPFIDGRLLLFRLIIDMLSDWFSSMTRHLKRNFCLVESSCWTALRLGRGRNVAWTVIQDPASRRA